MRRVFQFVGDLAGQPQPVLAVAGPVEQVDRGPHAGFGPYRRPAGHGQFHRRGDCRVVALAAAGAGPGQPQRGHQEFLPLPGVPGERRQGVQFGQRRGGHLVGGAADHRVFPGRGSARSAPASRPLRSVRSLRT